MAIIDDSYEPQLKALVIADHSGSFRDNYLVALESINRFSRKDFNIETQNWVIKQSGNIQDVLCEQQSNNFDYQGNGEIAFALRTFDHNAALLEKAEWLKVNDVSFYFDAYKTYDWFGVLPSGQFCLKVLSVKGIALLDEPLKLFSDSVVQTSLLQIETGAQFSMRDLSG